MNQKQREFLLESIQRQFREEKTELDARKPKAPSLNNYLVAAILDGSFVMKAPEVVRESIRKRVRDLSKGDALLERKHRFGREEDEYDCVTLPALVLFDEPPGYTEARVEYEARLAEWEKEEAALEAAFNAMRIKVQLGSNEALAALVDQADRLCSMSLTASSQLMLTGGKEDAR